MIWFHGTSSGSIIAVLYALGYTSDEMYKLLKKYTKKIRYVDIDNIFKIIIGLLFTGKIVVEGLNSGDFLIKAMKEVCKENNIQNINQIKMPIAIPAVSLQNGELMVFSSKQVRGEISDGIKYITDIPIDIAVRGSCSYPGVFIPCDYKNMQLIDGGVRDNTPWKQLKKMGADSVLGINFASEIETTSYNENMIEIVSKAMKFMEKELVNYELEGIDKLITITTKRVELLDTGKIDYLYKIGYKMAKEQLD